MDKISRSTHRVSSYFASRINYWLRTLLKIHHNQEIWCHLQKPCGTFIRNKKQFRVFHHRRQPWLDPRWRQIPNTPRVSMAPGRCWSRNASGAKRPVEVEARNACCWRLGRCWNCLDPNWCWAHGVCWVSFPRKGGHINIWHITYEH